MSNSLRKLIQDVLAEEYVVIRREGDAEEVWDLRFKDPNTITRGIKIEDTKTKLRQYIDPSALNHPKIDKMLDYIGNHPATSKLLSILDDGYGPGTLLQDPAGFDPNMPLQNSILDLSNTLWWPHIAGTGGGEGKGEYQIQCLFQFDPDANEPDVILANGDGYHIKASQKTTGGIKFRSSRAGPVTQIGKDIFDMVSNLYQQHGMGSIGNSVSKGKFRALLPKLTVDEVKKIKDLLWKAKEFTISDRHAKGLLILAPRGRTAFLTPGGPHDEMTINWVAASGEVGFNSLAGTNMFGESKERIKNIINEVLTKSDETRIQSIARREAKSEIKKVVGNNLKKTIQEELRKELGRKATQQEIADISKKVITKVYRELSYTYKPIIDRITI